VSPFLAFREGLMPIHDRTEALRQKFLTRAGFQPDRGVVLWRQALGIGFVLNLDQSTSILFPNQEQVGPQLRRAAGKEAMALEVIGAGFSRTATFSLKFALEHRGFGPCHHFSEIFAGGAHKVSQWLDVLAGRHDWETVFDGFTATVDTPACNYWRELADFYPAAKVVLTVRDPDSWFDSATETIFSDTLQSSLIGSPIGALMEGAILGVSGGPITDRAFMTAWFQRRNQEVIDTLPPERLLVFSPEDGWGPLCGFLGVPVPECPFPRVNRRDELTQVLEEQRGLLADPDVGMRVAREYIDQLRTMAFAG
jgi:hypothetical protein